MIMWWLESCAWGPGGSPRDHWRQEAPPPLQSEQLCVHLPQCTVGSQIKTSMAQKWVEVIGIKTRSLPF